MLILAIIILSISFYAGTAWFMIRELHTVVFFTPFEDLTFFGKCLFWYMYPALCIAAKM